MRKLSQAVGEEGPWQVRFTIGLHDLKGQPKQFYDCMLFCIFIASTYHAIALTYCKLDAF